MLDKNWKKFLLKSGLPFEYEVKECFAKFGCTVWDEYTYFKNDENEIRKEFSYDIDANYWPIENPSYSFNFMIECKYKTEPTQWFFLPDPYSYQDEINQNSFFHTFDHFLEDKFIYKQYPYYNVQEAIGPFCLKGTEIFSNNFVEINILKAINQLTYAFVNQVIASIESQLNDPFFEECTFFNIPIIITNAELNILNEKITTKDIQQAENINEISKKCNFLLYHNKTSESLRLYNIKLLTSYFKTIDKRLFKCKNKSFGEDVESFIDLMSSIYCPQSYFNYAP